MKREGEILTQRQKLDKNSNYQPQDSKRDFIGVERQKKAQPHEEEINAGRHNTIMKTGT